MRFLPFLVLVAACAPSAPTDPGAEPTTATDPDPTSPTVVDTGAPDACAAGALSAELGVLDEDLVPLGPGDPLELVFGGQGGWHVEFAAAVAGAHGDALRVLPTVTRLSTGEEVTLGGSVNKGMLDYDDATCTGVLPTIQAILDMARLPGVENIEKGCAVVGEEVELVVELEDLASGARTTERLVAPTYTRQDCP